MLDQLGPEGQAELQCGSHVSCLLSKLPHDLRAQFKMYVNPLCPPIPTLLDLAEWLEYEVRVQEDDTVVSHPRATGSQAARPRSTRVKPFTVQRFTTVLLVDPLTKHAEASKPAPLLPPRGDQPKKYCPYCNSMEHYNQCSAFKQLSTAQRADWIKTGKRCWRCGRDHQTAQYYLKARCQKCQRTHLKILHGTHLLLGPSEEEQLRVAEDCEGVPS